MPLFLGILARARPSRAAFLTILTAFSSRFHLDLSSILTATLPASPLSALSYILFSCLASAATARIRICGKSVYERIFVNGYTARIRICGTWISAFRICGTRISALHTPIPPWRDAKTRPTPSPAASIAKLNHIASHSVSLRYTPLTPAPHPRLAAQTAHTRPTSPPRPVRWAACPMGGLSDGWPVRWAACLMGGLSDGRPV